MQLSIEQALSRAIAAHDRGEFQDAERLYHAILIYEPEHPTANHNLGLLAVNEGRSEQALRFFGAALRADPSVEQFWLSYIGTLVKADQRGDAMRVVKKARKFGVDKKKLKHLISISSPVSKNKIVTGPSREQIESLLEHTQSGSYENAAVQAKAMTIRFPSHPFGWKVLGYVLKQMNRVDEALHPMQESARLDAEDAESHYNLGVLYHELGNFELAVESYARSIALKPDNIAAYENLGLTVRRVTFSSCKSHLYPVLINLLNSASFARPMDVADGMLDLLAHDPAIKDLLGNEIATGGFDDAIRTIQALRDLKLLHVLMRLCPLPSLQFESLFTALRKLLLTNLDTVVATPEVIEFLSSLSLQCFVNEYVYDETDLEFRLVEALEQTINEDIIELKQPEIKKVLCLALYRPLHSYPWVRGLTALDDMVDVKSRLIDQPQEEKDLAKNIERLGQISNPVSYKVREQYEQNPYPRWVNAVQASRPKSIFEICTDLNLHLRHHNIKGVTSPSILVAGCGTGQQSIETASRFAGCRVKAVDLSLASLAYAKRKTKELEIKNLEYIQADILELAQIRQEFDIIECVGVLHHMDDPMVGWNILQSLLKPGGLMRIGLYSELARGEIVRARMEIACLGIGQTESEIRRFRRSVKSSGTDDMRYITESKDFFALSDFRDLVFHVQEHRFNLLQIRSCLRELGLHFCGFESQDLIPRFRECHGDKADIGDLGLWHEFEDAHPYAFAGMYQFWCQKPAQ